MEVKKLRSLFCYLCGRQFGTASLQIHLKACQKKFNIEQDKKQPKQRIKLPIPPPQIKTILSGNFDQATMESYNQNAIKIHKYNVLPPCKFCGRTFKEESLKAHQNGCNLKSRSNKLSEQKSYQLPQDFKKPRTLTCCICGRDFGLTSLKIHYPRCIEKFNNQEILKQKEKRRQLPQFPQDYLQMINNKVQWTNDQIQQFNQNSISLYREKGLIECLNCKRKFFPQSIDKHRKNCILINGQSQQHRASRKSLKPINPYQTNIRKPKILMCHICGRQFGLTSLTIHLKQCCEKFNNEENKKPLKQRKVVPVFASQIKFDLEESQRWPIETIQQYNKIANAIYRNQSMAACWICGRKFLQQSLPKHLKYCQKYNKGKSQQKSLHSLQRPKSSTSLAPQSFKKPRVLMCHICGRQFGLKSLQIHQKQCEIKFHNLQNKKALSQRKQLPVLPTTQQQFDISQAQSWLNDKIQRFNQIATKVYRDKSLYQCIYCHRKFFEESLPKHLKHCQKNKGNKSRQSINLDKLKSQDVRKPKVLMCCICGREFGLASLIIHQKQCQKKFINEENKKPISERKPIPQMPSQKSFDLSNAENWNQEQIENFNQIANNIYRQQSLDKCPICMRKFFRQSLPKHLKFCTKNKEKQQQKKRLMEAKARKTFNKSLGKQKQLKLQRMTSLKLIKKPNSTFQQITEQQHNQHQDQQILDSQNVIQNNQQKQYSQIIHQQTSQLNQSPSPQKQKQNNYLKKRIFDRHRKRQEQFNQTVSQRQQQMEETIKGGQSKINNTQDIEQKIINNQKYQVINKNKKNDDSIMVDEQQKDKINQNFNKNKSIQDIEIQKVQKKSLTQLPISIQEKLQNNTCINDFNCIEQQSSNNHIQTAQCKGCLRQFDCDRIDKHQKVCKKAQQFIANDYKQKIKIQRSLNIDQKSYENQKIERAQCYKCKRKFAIDKLLKHQQICKTLINQQTKKQIQNVVQQSQKLIQSQKKDQNNLLVECIGCNRKFNQGRIQKHQQVCKKAQQAQLVIDQKLKASIKQLPKQKIIYNSEQVKSIKRQQCKKCGRKFDVERLSKHVEICKGLNDLSIQSNKTQKINNLPNLQNKKNINNTDNIIEQQIKNQLSLEVCSKCGRNFKKDRITKHQQVCKGVLQQQRKSKNVGNDITSRKTNLEKYSNNNINNNLINKSYELPNQNMVVQNLQECQKCCRKFNLDRIAKHRDVCKGLENNKNQNIIKGNNKQDVRIEPKIQGLDQYISVELASCKKCNRKFDSERIQKHQEVCKGKGRQILNKTQLKKQEQQVRKTSKQFFNMVKEIKQKKKQQRQIDKQIDQALNSVGKSIKVTKKNTIIKDTNAFLPRIQKRQI